MIRFVLFQVRDDQEPTIVSAIPRTECDPNKTYIITGGLGGFGLELSHWLMRRGARSLVLSSRSGVRTGYQARKLAYLRSQGVDIVVSTKKITDRAEVVELVQEGGKPVGGVFHLAAVSDLDRPPFSGAGGCRPYFITLHSRCNEPRREKPGL